MTKATKFTNSKMHPNPTDMLDALNLFKLLSDNTRLSILLLLKTKGQLCVCELEEGLKVDQPKVSRHLALMRNAGLLQTEKKGKWVYYEINKSLPGWIGDILSFATNNSQEKIKELTKALASFQQQNCC